MDIVERLRAWQGNCWQEAADEIERLRAAIPIVPGGHVLVCLEEGEIERLRAECLRLSHAEAEAMSVVLSLEGQAERLRAEVAAKDKFVKEAIEACSDAGRLREFFLWVFEDFPESFPDGFAMQDEAERLELLVDAKPKEPCGEGCACVEYYSQDEWDAGEVKCLRRAEWLNAELVGEGKK